MTDRRLAVHASCADCPPDCTNWECIEQCPCDECAEERTHFAPDEPAHPAAEWAGKLFDAARAKGLFRD